MSALPLIQDDADPAWFAAAPDPMAKLNAEGGVVWSNAAFQGVFRHAIGPRRAPWGRFSPPSFADGKRVFEAPTPDGRRFEWSQRVLPCGGSFLVARDVTARIAAEAEATRAKALLFATMTHELRTPLSGILGMAALLGQSRLEPAEQEYLSAIRQSGEHLLDLITEILDYSRLETGRLSLESHAFAPGETLQSVAELLAPKAHEKGLEIVAVSEGDASIRVIGDEGRIRQILFNLAGNAVKFTESGGVTLGFAPQGGGRWRLQVRDTGPGVPVDKQERIFEEFSQADASIARRYGGAGLGLAIVRRLALAMGGVVGLDSRPGAGATFYVDLPLALASPSHAEGGSLAAEDLSGLMVGVLARERVLREGAMALARQAGAGVAGSADLALPGTGLDAVLVDHGLLADRSAAAVGAFLAQSPPAVVMIAPEDRGKLERYRALGLARYLIKPLRRLSLAEHVKMAARGVLARPAVGGADAAADDRLAPHSLLGLKVLLAEDNPVNALLARTVLTRAGGLVTVAADGEEALEAFRAAEGDFDLVLLDLRMPRLDGLGAARRLRTMGEKGANVPIVALTAEASAEDRVAALAAGMNDFATKPIGPGALEALAGRCIKGRGGA
jgi:signal transduction histidine kinase/CheY-like chemotaxis protein